MSYFLKDTGFAKEGTSTNSKHLESLTSRKTKIHQKYRSSITMKVISSACYIVTEQCTTVTAVISDTSDIDNVSNFWRFLINKLKLNARIHHRKNHTKCSPLSMGILFKCSLLNQKNHSIETRNMQDNISTT